MQLFKLFKQDSWVRPFLKKYRRSLILALILGFATFFCASALMFNSGYLISRSAALPENILLVYVPIVLTRAFGIGRPVFRYLERLTSHNWVLRLTSRLRLKLYQTLEQDAVFFKNQHQTGDVLGLLSDDIAHLQNLYLRTVFPTVIAWLIYVFIILALGWFSWWFGLVMLLFFGIIIFAFPLWSLLATAARQEQRKQLRTQLYTELTDNILGVSDWIFSQRTTDYLTTHQQHEQRLAEVKSQLQQFDRRRDFMVQVVFGIIAIMLLVWSSFRFPGSHGGAANWIAAFVLSLFPLVDAFAPLSQAAEETNIYQDSLKRLNQLPAIAAATAGETSQVLQGPYTLKIEQLHFTYPQAATPALQQLDLTIKPGEKLAILGRSGSGKTTLAHLLRGDLKPTGGSVTLNGQPTWKLADQISRYIGVLHQAPYLFHTTLSNNLRLADENATDQQLWDVIERVGLKELVSSLPQQLETEVDEAGLRFSGGERHRLALARILLQQVPIVILDEPTVSLDPITEQALIETFNQQLHDKTLIWITHHLQGLSLMDQIIFIEDGQLQLSGSPEKLAANNQHYQQLLAVDRGIWPHK
ncbi:MAG: thiol reductant ABC exporter subunit CydC [Liquorilactobacillus ghanensis]|uniref:thiol reductant ABC exporter subunit CydC n=1 Tax=Liquorilactobacillus ghanensis TaxID=399370 RepID=UPI0039E74640